jgi:replicative DNA helicase
VFLYRDEVYNPETPQKGVAEVIVAKQRNGPIGVVECSFDGRYTRFGNLANEYAYVDDDESYTFANASSQE